MRSFLAWLTLLLAVAILPSALVAHVAHETALDPDRLGRALAQDSGSDELRRQVLTAAPEYADLPASVRTEVERTISTPRVNRWLERVTIDSQGIFDLTPVRRQIVRELTEAGHPDLATRVASTPVGAAYRIPPRIWQPYQEARQASRQVALAGGALASALLLASILVARDRRRATSRAGAGTLVGVAIAVALLWATGEAAPHVSDHPVAQALASHTNYLDVAAPTFLTAAAAGTVLLLLGSLSSRLSRSRRA